mgnify:CR=1 FL=1
MKHIKSYELFESSGFDNFPKTKSSVDIFCKKLGLNDYNINDDLTVDVNFVDLSKRHLVDFPIKFNEVNIFMCTQNPNLTSLKGCPKIVLDDFNVMSCGITDTTYLPESVGDIFNCSYNKITTTEIFKVECTHLLYKSNPIYKLINRISEVIGDNFGIEIGSKRHKEIAYRLDEFNVIKEQNKIDMISLNSLLDYYNTKFDENDFIYIEGYEYI